MRFFFVSLMAIFTKNGLPEITLVTHLIGEYENCKAGIPAFFIAVNAIIDAIFF